MQLRGIVILLVASVTVCAVAQRHRGWMYYQPKGSETETELEEVPDSLRVRELAELELEYGRPVDYDRFLSNMLYAPNIYHAYRHVYGAPQLDTVSLNLNHIAEVRHKLLFAADTLFSRRLQQMDEIQDIRFVLQTARPQDINNFYWRLPRPKTLDGVLDDQYIEELGKPIVAGIRSDVLFELQERHWLHLIDGGIQFSQAYLSPNWYQGGNNNLTLLINALWQVQLNQVFHSKLLFENVLSYKLGMYTNGGDQLHKYSISEDLFQWNMKVGYKAINRWFYSFTLQLKTQFLNNYPADSNQRTAGFFSPGDMNLGLGMTYARQNKKKTFTFNLSMAPVSYNLKTCVDRQVEPTQFGIETGRRTASQIGSSVEYTMSWKMCKNIEYRTRLFAFTNYKYFQADWENTLSFAVNKWLSTQIYVHVRYDSSSELTENKWRHWMLKEILSFGLRYTFSTKQ